MSMLREALLEYCDVMAELDEKIRELGPRFHKLAEAEKEMEKEALLGLGAFIGQLAAIQFVLRGMLKAMAQTLETAE